ncbi:MAG: tRNA lysidine(34) synthetase TilS, partial [Steroidobacteraceae bacterium]
ADVGRLRDGDALSVPGLRALNSQERIHALRLWLREAGVEPPPEARLIEALRQILEAEADHLPAVKWGGHALRRYRHRVFLTETRAPRLEAVLRWSAAPGSALDLGSNLGVLRWTSQSGGIDARRLPETLTVRRRSGGETLKPGSLAKTHSVQHLCQSQGVLPWLRDALPLVFAGDSLIAVADLWLDARWCVALGDPGLGLAWERGPIIV